MKFEATAAFAIGVILPLLETCRESCAIQENQCDGKEWERMVA